MIQFKNVVDWNVAENEGYLVISISWFMSRMNVTDISALKLNKMAIKINFRLYIRLLTWNHQWWSFIIQTWNFASKMYKSSLIIEYFIWYAKSNGWEKFVINKCQIEMRPLTRTDKMKLCRLTEPRKKKMKKKKANKKRKYGAN